MLSGRKLIASDTGSEVGSRDQLLQSFSSFCPAVQRIISYAGSDVKVWQLLDMESLPTWTSENLVLIGDAAHPFLPCKFEISEEKENRFLTHALDLGQGGAPWRLKMPFALPVSCLQA